MRGIIYDDHKREIALDTEKDTLIIRKEKTAYYYKLSRKGNKIYYKESAGDFFPSNEDEVLEVSRHNSTPYPALGDPYHDVIFVTDAGETVVPPGRYWSHTAAAKEIGVTDATIRSQMTKYNLGVKIGSMKLLQKADVEFLRSRKH